MKKHITFTNILNLDFFPPKPATKEIPEWYKDTPEYIGGLKIIFNDGIFSQTIKKCIPIFDTITAGYILYTQVDVQISIQNNEHHYTWPDQQPISWHPIEQAPLYPLKNKGEYPKWNNPYAITTPPGYSVLFTPPMHRESIFTILPGIVDTDKYKSPVQFPFIFNDLNWEGIIPAGTPMAQVIPFKRESWQYKIGSDDEIKEQEKVHKKLRTKFFNSYKQQFWSKKEYR